MGVRSTFAFMRLAILFFLAGTPFVAYFANIYPAQVVPIVLIGALVFSAPLGLMLSRAIQQGREDEFAARYRKFEGGFFLAAALSQASMIVLSLGREDVGPVGMVLSTVAMLAASWLLFKAAPTGRPDAGFLAPIEPGR